MAIGYKDLKTNREWKSTIGLSQAEFQRLCILFQTVYEKHHGYTIQVSDDKVKLTFKTYEDCVFFVTFQLKQGLNFDTLGFVFGTDGSNAHRHFSHLLKLLEISLSTNGFMPKRKFKDVKEFTDYLSDESELIIDVSEESIERPQDKEKQKDHFSGKKNNIQSKN